MPTDLQTGPGQRARPEGRDALLNALRETLARTPRLAPVVPDLPFSGGLVGVSAYDLVRHFERLPNAPVACKQSAGAGSRLSRRRVAAGFRSPDAAYRAAACRQRGRASAFACRGHPFAARRLPAAPVAGRQDSTGQSLSREQFLQAVAASKESITRGDVYQLVLSVQFTGTHSLSPFEAYRALRLLNPSPYMYFIDLGDIQVAGSSPEALVKLRRDTPRCGRSPARGRAVRRRSRTGARTVAARRPEKENAEHVMLVDLARNDLGRVARGRFRARRSLSQHRTLQPRDAHRQRRAGRARAGTRCLRPVRGRVPGRHAGRCAEGAGHGDHRRAGAGTARLYGGTVGYFGATATWTRPSRSARWCSAVTPTATRPVPASWPTAFPRAEYDEVLAKSAILREALKMAEEGL
jgi:anthranilate synthase component 1